MSNEDPTIVDLLVARYIKDQNLDYNIENHSFRQVIADLEEAHKLLPNVVKLSARVREQQGFCCMTCHTKAVWDMVRTAAQKILDDRGKPIPDNVVLFPGPCTVH